MASCPAGGISPELAGRLGVLPCHRNAPSGLPLATSIGSTDVTSELNNLCTWIQLTEAGTRGRPSTMQSSRPGFTQHLHLQCSGKQAQPAIQHLHSPLPHALTFVPPWQPQNPLAATARRRFRMASCVASPPPPPPARGRAVLCLCEAAVSSRSMPPACGLAAPAHPLAPKSPPSPSPSPVTPYRHLSMPAPCSFVGVSRSSSVRSLPPFASLFFLHHLLGTPTAEVQTGGEYRSSTWITAKGPCGRRS